MMGCRQGRLLVFGAVLILVVVSCTRDDGLPTATGPGGGSVATPQEATIVAVDYEYVEAPTELDAGVIHMRFENQGTVDHEIGLAAIGDTPIDEWTGWLETADELSGEGLPGYVRQFEAASPFLGLGGGKSAEATVILTAGRYAMICAYTTAAGGGQGPPHYRLGMARELIVSEGDGNPVLPEADGTVTATDYAFDVDIEAGDRTINFINLGPAQGHVAVVEVFPKGVDAVEAAEAVEARLQPGRPPKDTMRPSGFAYSGIYSEGLGGTFEPFHGSFESGRTYLFTCPWFDREGSPPHTGAYGMYAIVAIE